MKKLLLLALVLLFSLGVFGVSSQEAKNFLLNETHYLETGESLEIFPETSITSDGKGYWVSTIFNGDSLVGFIPVKEEKKEVSFDPVTNRGLFKTMYFLRQLSDSKQEIARRGEDWFFSIQELGYFSDLYTSLLKEGNHLDIIDGELQSLEATALIEEMSQSLNRLINSTEQIKEELEETIKLENSFSSSPDTNQLSKLKSRYESVLDLVTGMDQYVDEYDLKLSELKGLIAVSDLDAGSKKSLGDIADKEIEFQRFEQKSNSAASTRQWLGLLFSTADSSMSNWLDNLESDKQMNDSWELLNGEDKQILTASNNSLGSLSEAAELILHEDNRPYWKNQEMVAKLGNDWKNAKKFFEQKRFELIPSLAASVRNEIKQIIADGMQDTEPFDLTQLAVNIVIYLIVLLIILFVLKNRSKLFSMGGEEKEKGERNYELK